MNIFLKFKNAVTFIPINEFQELGEKVLNNWTFLRSNNNDFIIFLEGHMSVLPHHIDDDVEMTKWATSFQK